MNVWSDRLPLLRKTTLSDKRSKYLCNLFTKINETVTIIWPLLNLNQ